ncbi:MAG TPA: hypothetical protein VHJ20_08070 [Polyangia bacterium]|nr:hypothetical protein [Polyangia bacterium]
MTDQNDTPVSVDLERHAQAAVSGYLKVRDFYRDLASAVSRVVEECLRHRGLNAHSVDARAKDPSSFQRKAAIPKDADPSQPKYPAPLRDITDLAGVRIITYFPSDLALIDTLLAEEFEITERSDKSEILVQEDRFGYQSVHYLVRFSERRSDFAEYSRFRSAVAEVQVRTILQHAWAEIEHDIQYKASATIPTEIHRRFTALAGLLEIADREFQAIQDEDKKLRSSARSNVDQGQLDAVEVTPDALKAYLDGRMGPDGRISDWQYDWMARLMRRLGFRDLKQIDECVANYDDDQLSRLVWHTRLGQVGRFEMMLLAGMGHTYIERAYPTNTWYQERLDRGLKAFVEAGIAIRTYDPKKLESK